MWGGGSYQDEYGNKHVIDKSLSSEYPAIFFRSFPVMIISDKRARN